MQGLTNCTIASLVARAESHIHKAKAAWSDLTTVQHQLGRARSLYALADRERHRMRGAYILNNQPYYILKGE